MAALAQPRIYGCPGSGARRIRSRLAASGRIAGVQPVGAFGGGLRRSSGHLPLRTRARYASAAWDMAGAFTLVGCAAAILGEIEPIIEFIRPSGPRSKVND
jgi:hypothetical protein